MSPLSPKEILGRVKEEGFENVWRESARLLPRQAERQKLVSDRRGVPHSLYELIQKLRISFLDLGFSEVSNPVIVDESEIYRQYGPEAPIILDRCYYLATLPRPDVGLGRAKCEAIRKTGVKLTEAKVSTLKKVLRDYKKGDIDSDDLVEEVAEALEVPDTVAMRVISDVFPEFLSLRPEPTRQTLRSHITSAWFITLQALQGKTELPLRLFSIDIRFRREQREDQTHLRVHHAASCVIMDQAVAVEDGEEITKALLKPLGFRDFRFMKKKVTSKYYALGMEYEGFVFNPASSEWTEVVDYGLYNPIALARYELEYPVLNVGMGIERLAMILHGEADVRKLVYPQFNMELTLSDSEIAKMIWFEEEPQTKAGRELERALLAQALRNADAPSPCEFLAYDGELLGRKVKVYLYEKESNSRLLGAAAQNRIYVHKGNIVGVPLEGLDEVLLVNQARLRGVPTEIRYIDGIACFAAARVENAVRTGQKSLDMWVRQARRLRDVNVKIGEVARRFITSKKKKIEISGPLFIGVRAEISE